MDKKSKSDSSNSEIATGLSLGLIFGLLFDNLALGLLIGIAVSVLTTKKILGKRKEKSNTEENETLQQEK